jgi:hypothetical protein
MKKIQVTKKTIFLFKKAKSYKGGTETDPVWTVVTISTMSH